LCARARNAPLRQARRLGLSRGKTLILESYDELHYVNDLAIYTAPADRARAVDRYARSARSELQSRSCMGAAASLLAQDQIQPARPSN